MLVRNNRVGVAVAGVTSSILPEVESILEKCGLRLEATSNQKEAIRMLSQKPRMVITTLDADGFELLRDTCRYCPEAEVVLLESESTGNTGSNFELAVRACQCGGRVIPQKAFDRLEALVERLATSNESRAGVRWHPRLHHKRIKIADAKRESRCRARFRGIRRVPVLLEGVTERVNDVRD